MHINVINEVMSCNKSVTEPVVGMGATMYCGSDRYAMVVTEVLTPKKIKVAHVLDNHEKKFITDENGIMFLPEEFVKEYEKFVPDEFGYRHFYVPRTYTFRKNHRWIEEGKGLWETGGIHLGEADNYRDPNY